MPISHTMPILVADDNRTTIRIVRNLLSQLGFKQVDDVPDGLAALVKMSEKKYELVIADWNMEPMTGYELLKQVRADPRYSGLRFIMITAEANTEHVIAAKKAGVSNYIIKPFTAETLKSKIEASFLA
jgi:two-component system chemotaxis response regulator CheY